MQQYHKNNLNLLNWNANGINNKKLELTYFLNDKKINLACITETHLKSDVTFNISGYSVVRTDRSNANGGGVLILIEKSIPFIKVNLPHTPGLETIAIKFPLNNRLITLIAAYKPPKSKISDSNISALFQMNSPTLLIGDLNAKNTIWGCRNTNTAGRQLSKIITDLKLQLIIPAEPTHYPTDYNKHPDILDIAISNTQTTFHSAPFFELDSDHLPTIISTQQITPPHTPTLTLNTQNINWKKFKNIIQKQSPHFKILKTPVEIEQAIAFLNNMIINTINILNNNAQPPTTKHFNKKLPKNILTIINTRNKTRRLWCIMRNPQLKKELNLLSNIVKKSLREHKQTTYNNLIQSLSTNNNTLWQFTKNILKKKAIIPPLTTPTGKKFASYEKAEALADHFAKSFTPNATPTHPLHSKILEIASAPNYNVPHKINYISPNEVINIIKNLPIKKAPGHDKISNKILKNLPKPTIAYITNIYNSIIRTGYFPVIWKNSNVIPIPKPFKNLSRTENYRPISLLPTLSKILEKLILKRLNSHLNKTQTIPMHQFGFTNKVSTSHQLLRITEHIHTAFQKKEHTIVTFLDISKAFDKVWYPGLIFKLKEIGTPNYLINTINSFLQDRTFSVTVNNHTSNPRRIIAGLPQGSPLSPTLFNIYTADIPITSHTHIAQFADDTAIFMSNHSTNQICKQIQTHLNKIDEWSVKWKIKLNPTKSCAKIFSLRTFSTPTPLRINNNPIPWISHNESVKYLGLNLDTRLNWKNHITVKAQQAKIKLIQLKPLLNRNSKLSLNNAITIYKSIIRPLMLYACPIWINASKTNINKLQIIQNNFLRLATHAPWFISNIQLHKEFNLPPILYHIALLSNNFFSKINTITQATHYGLATTYQLPTRIKNRYPLDSFLSIFSEVN